MIQHDKLCHSSASNVTGFLAARVILGHLVSCPPFAKQDSQPGWLCYVVQHLRKCQKCCILLHYVASRCMAGKRKSPAGLFDSPGEFLIDCRRDFGS